MSSAGRNKTILTLQKEICNFRLKEKMSAKCTSQNLSETKIYKQPESFVCLCYDWFLKYRQQSQTYQQHNQANYQELLSIYNNLSSGIYHEEEKRTHEQHRP